MAASLLRPLTYWPLCRAGTTKQWEFRNCALPSIVSDVLLYIVTRYTEQNVGLILTPVLWEVRELLVRTGTVNSERDLSRDGEDQTTTGGDIQIEARFSTSGDTLGNGVVKSQNEATKNARYSPDLFLARLGPLTPETHR